MDCSMDTFYLIAIINLWPQILTILRNYSILLAGIAEGNSKSLKESEAWTNRFLGLKNCINPTD